MTTVFWLLCCCCLHVTRAMIVLMMKKRARRLDHHEDMRLYFCLLIWLVQPGLNLHPRHVRLLDAQSQLPVQEYVNQYAEQVVPHAVLHVTNKSFRRNQTTDLHLDNHILFT